MKNAIVIYDGDCGICSQFKKIIERWDTHHQIYFKPFQDAKTLIEHPFLNLLDCEKEIQLIENNQISSTGADAIRSIFFKIPLFVPIAMFLWLPGVRHLNRIFYRYIADNRHRISSTCGLKK